MKPVQQHQTTNQCTLNFSYPDLHVKAMAWHTGIPVRGIQHKTQRPIALHIKFEKGTVFDIDALRKFLQTELIYVFNPRIEPKVTYELAGNPLKEELTWLQDQRSLTYEQACQNSKAIESE